MSERTRGRGPGLHECLKCCQEPERTEGRGPSSLRTRALLGIWHQANVWWKKPLWNIAIKSYLKQNTPTILTTAQTPLSTYMSLTQSL